ncbi:MAG: flagellar motor switch protein FliN [Saccharospirillum sp.]
MSDENFPPEEEQQAADAGDEAVDDEALAEEWAAAMAESGDDQEDEDDDQGDAARAPLEEFGASQTYQRGDDTPNLDVILDIPVTISMEVGNTQIPIRNLLQLNQGSVIELDRLAGEPLDVLVNGTLIAHGEVVMVNEKFGIRLTDVVSQQERIQRLK